VTPLGRRGISLVEVLVAVAILGIVLAALLSLTVSTTSFTARSTVISDVTRDLSDASGYLSDAFRQAASVVDLSGGTVSFDLVGGGTVQCQLGDCVAFWVPQFSEASGAVEGEWLNVYQIVVRDTLPSHWRSDAAYTGSDSTTGAVVRFVGSSSGSTQLVAQPSLLIDNIVLAGSALVFTDADDELRVTLQVGRLTRQGVILSPAAAPLETVVFRRN